MSFKTEAFVLKNIPFREADRLYTLFTSQEGILQAILKSAAKSNSKQAGHLPPFAKVKIMIGRGKMDHLAGVHLVKDFSNLRSNIKLMSLASSLLELYLKESSGGQKIEEYYLLENILYLLDNKEISLNKKILLTRIFLWKYLSLAGWQPELNKCVICNIKINNGNYWPGYGIICTKHEQEEKVNLSHNCQELLKKIINNSWSELINLNINKELNKEWFKLSQLFYEAVYEKPGQALKLYNYG